MTRPVWKVPFIHKIFLNSNLKFKKQIKLKIRNSIIPYSFIGKVFQIYNGTWYSSFTIKPEMVGLKLGEFSFSRRVGTQKHLKIKRRKKGSKHDKKNKKTKTKIEE